MLNVLDVQDMSPDVVRKVATCLNIHNAMMTISFNTSVPLKYFVLWIDGLQ